MRHVRDVYIGSAIYTTGVVGVEEQFNVSQTVATLGLIVFVLGYGIGEKHDTYHRAELR